MQGQHELPGFVFPRQLSSRLATAVAARDCWIEDADGHRLLDASGGPLVVNVGHGRPEVARAVHDQILQCDYVHPTMFTGAPVEALAATLARLAPEGIERFYFMSSGSEAIQTAIKMARQVHLAQGAPQRFRLISRWKSYHGLTLGALSATGRTAFRQAFTPMLPETAHIDPPYCYRCAFGKTYPDCRLRCADALEEMIQNLGPETVSAFLAETVSGATIAAAVPPPGYWRRIREICDRYGVLLILDEVFCGFGRTGRWFAAEHHDVVPDLVTMGKGLSGGAIGLSAVGIQQRHFDRIRSGQGVFMHGGTFSHHQVACAAGNAVIAIIEQEQLVDRVARLGPQLGGCLADQLADHPHVGDIRGVGFMWGVEFVQDRETRRPFPRQERITERLWQYLYDQGVLLYKSTGLAGTDGDALVIGPPFVMAENDIERVVSALKAALHHVFPG
jgi:adenosylmethionine-8-amino-7-oxononanoate aminotransferase